MPDGASPAVWSNKEEQIDLKVKSGPREDRVPRDARHETPVAGASRPNLSPPP